MRHFIVPAIAIMVLGAGPQATGGELRSFEAHAANSEVTIIGSTQADGVLGKEVRSKSGERMGRLIDVVVDRMGRTRAAIIDFGGFLGVGSRKVAVDWNALGFEPEGAERDVITVDMTRDQLKAAPEYKDRRAVIVVGSLSKSE